MIPSINPATKLLLSSYHATLHTGTDENTRNYGEGKVYMCVSFFTISNLTVSFGFYWKHVLDTQIKIKIKNRLSISNQRENKTKLVLRT